MQAGPQPPDPTQPPGTSLDLPAAAVPSPVGSADIAPAERDVEAPAPGILGNLVVAHFRRVDNAMLGRVLVGTLAGALPAGIARVERRRSFGRRLTGREGDPVGITISYGDRMLALRAPEDGPVDATTGHVVRGVVLSSTQVPVTRWLDELGDLLAQLARDDEATGAALERILLS